jgi:hypothetical protein
MEQSDSHQRHGQNSIANFGLLSFQPADAGSRIGIFRKLGSIRLNDDVSDIDRLTV